MDTPVDVVVEGETDLPVARRLLQEAGHPRGDGSRKGHDGGDGPRRRCDA
jgi:hypothetical protein